MNENILNGILIFGAIQAVFFSLLFITKKKTELPDRIIAIWLLLLSINIITIFTAKTVDNPYLKVLQVSFTLLHGVFLYLYSRKLTIENASFQKTDFLHFPPFLISIFVGIFFIPNYTKILNLIAISGIISGMSYSVLVIYQLINHRRIINNKFSYTEKINLNWLLHLAVGLLIIWFVASVSGVLLRFFHYNIPVFGLFVFIPVFIFYIGFYSIKQNIIYSGLSEKTSVDNIRLSKKRVTKSGKYKKSKLQKDIMKSINEKLISAMKEEQLFLNSNLSLSELSKFIKIPSHQITQTLNEFRKQTFYDFVNYYRVEEFKKKILLPENDSFSLLGIAFDCGFNSKSSFNRIFKKYTGQNPSEYKKNSNNTQFISLNINTPHK